MKLGSQRSWINAGNCGRPGREATTLLAHGVGLTRRGRLRFIRNCVCERSTMDSVAASEAVDPGSTPGASIFLSLSGPMNCQLFGRRTRNQPSLRACSIANHQLLAETRPPLRQILILGGTIQSAVHFAGLWRRLLLLVLDLRSWRACREHSGPQRGVPFGAPQRALDGAEAARSTTQLGKALIKSS